MSVVRLSPEAIDELAEAALPRLLDVPEDLVIRRALLPRFPYAVVFMDLGTEIRDRGRRWPRPVLSSAQWSARARLEGRTVRTVGPTIDDE